MKVRLILAAVAAALVLGACGDDDGAGPAAGAEADTTAVPASSGGPQAGASEISFAFAADEGAAACTYEGPAEVATTIVSTAVNRAGEPINVTLARLADDASPEDFEAYVRSLGDPPPVTIPPGDHEPRRHEWMQGEWLELHTDVAGTAQTVERTSLFPGEYVAFCFRRTESGGGSVLWPAGSLTVVG